MRHGATLPELVMVTVIIGILALIARPSFASLFDRAAVISATSEVVSVLGAARHTAIVQGRFVAVRFDRNTSRVIAFDRGDTLIHRDLRAAHRVTLTATRDSIAFYPTGRGYGAGNTSVVLSRGRAADTVVVSRLGRVRH